MPPPTGHWWSQHGPGARHFLLLPVIVSTLRGVAIAAPLDVSNLTIDNASGRDEFNTAPFFSANIPSGSAQDDTIARWVDQTCTGCSNQPDPGRLTNGTYSALYLPPGNPFIYEVSFRFNGSAVYVYLVLSNQANTECFFILDETPVPYVGATMDPYQYKTLAFAKAGLGMTEHHLIIRAEGKPDAANYFNFDFAQFTPPTPRSLTSDPSQSDTPIPTPTPTRNPNNHLTAKSIAGGVVGGFIAVVALIVAASFYRRRHRPKKPKDNTDHIHPFPAASPIATMSDEERHRLMSLSLPQSLHHHHHQQHSSHETHSGQLSAGYEYDANRREYVRQQRQRELNDRLEAVKRQMRDLKATFMTEQQVAHARGQQAPGSMDEYDDGLPPAFRIVPGGMGQHPHDSALADMREQMRIMMDEIQYLRAQQSSSYVQGLTDDPPPGYLQATNSSRYQP